MKREVPSVESLGIERLRELFGSAMGGSRTDASCEEMLALSAYALSTLNGFLPAALVINDGHMRPGAQVTILPFVRPDQRDVADDFP